MCFLCRKLGGELAVFAVSIEGKPEVYAHQKCIDANEKEIDGLMFEFTLND